MTYVDTLVYPELRQLFGAYLNAEFAARYGSVARALGAYGAETGRGHRSAARAELDRITAEPGAVMQLHRRFEALGCEVHLPNSGAAWQLAATLRRALETDPSDSAS
jgi:hypothetical protein